MSGLKDAVVDAARRLVRSWIERGADVLDSEPLALRRAIFEHDSARETAAAEILTPEAKAVLDAAVPLYLAGLKGSTSKNMACEYAQFERVAAMYLASLEPKPAPPRFVSDKSTLIDTRHPFYERFVASMPDAEQARICAEALNRELGAK